jgi:3-methyladenine DNA glycosylase AlkC
VKDAREDIAHIVIKAEDVLRPLATESVDAWTSESNRTRLLINQDVNRAVAGEYVCTKRCDDQYGQQEKPNARSALL